MTNTMPKAADIRALVTAGKITSHQGFRAFQGDKAMMALCVKLLAAR